MTPVPVQVWALTGEYAAGVAVSVPSAPSLKVCATDTGPCTRATEPFSRASPSVLSVAGLGSRIACPGVLALEGRGEVEVPEPLWPVHLTSTWALLLSAPAGSEKQVPL